MNINNLAVVDSLKEERDDFLIVGDYARGLISDSHTPSDTIHLVTSNSDVLMRVTLLTKMRFFNSYHHDRRYKKDNFAKLEIVSAKFDRDVSEEDELSESYLTKEEIARVGEEFPRIKFKTSKNCFYDNKKTGLINPEEALVVYDFILNDMKFRIHIVEKGAEEKYALSIPPALTFMANMVGVYPNDKVLYLDKDAEKDITDRVISNFKIDFDVVQWLVDQKGWKSYEANQDAKISRKRNITQEDLQYFLNVTQNANPAPANPVPAIAGIAPGGDYYTTQTTVTFTT